jgi:hypothetical protein
MCNKEEQQVEKPKQAMLEAGGGESIIVHRTCRKYGTSIQLETA